MNGLIIYPTKSAVRPYGGIQDRARSTDRGGNPIQLQPTGKYTNVSRELATVVEDLW
jgi:hypothetical protein